MGFYVLAFMRRAYLRAERGGADGGEVMMRGTKRGQTLSGRSCERAGRLLGSESAALIWQWSLLPTQESQARATVSGVSIVQEAVGIRALINQR